MKSKGVDFSSMFAPDEMGDGPIAEGYMVAGVPQRYAHIMYGTKREDIGYAENGVDLSNKWAAAGTAVYVRAPALGTIEVLVTGVSSATGSFTLVVRRNGECDADTSSTPGGSAHFDSSWFAVANATIGDQYEVMLTPVFTSGTATVTNGAESYSVINADRSITFTRTVPNQTVVTIQGHINIKIKKISTNAVLLDFNQPFHMEVGNDA
jgi:hypothetical protein